MRNLHPRTVGALARAATWFLGLGLIAAGGLAFYHFDVSHLSTAGVWLCLVLPFALVIVGLVVCCVAASDNFHNVRSGVVIDQLFTAAHTTAATYVPATSDGNGGMTAPLYIPGHDVPDDWALQLRDERGLTGWIHFSTNPFRQYPVGSTYPGRR